MNKSISYTTIRFGIFDFERVKMIFDMIESPFKGVVPLLYLKFLIYEQRILFEEAFKIVQVELMQKI